MSVLSTVYIISKGRPQCHTARSLTKMNYPGDWFIVCGNNDETLEQYLANWGSDRVLVFDWYEAVKHTDTMDNFGFDDMASGAVPARNAVFDFSRERGERRHWQFDDDYTGFQITDPKTMKRPVEKNGERFMRVLERIAEFGDSTGLANVGFATASIEAMPQNFGSYARRVFNAHNMSNDACETWRGRMNDDLINAIDTYRRGKAELSFKFISMNMPSTQKEGGGLTDIYKEEGTVRKTAYAIMAAPGQVRLVEKFGRYHHSADWNCICPKIVSGAYA